MPTRRAKSTTPSAAGRSATPTKAPARRSAELKTRPGAGSVEAFLAAIPDAGRRADCAALVELMREATGAPARMWGSSIVGFGDYRYRYASGREGDWFLVGFSPRAQNLTLYLMAGYTDPATRAILARLGPHKLGRSCLYLKRLGNVDSAALRDLVRHSIARSRAQWGG